MNVDDVVSALGWSVVATVIAQIVSILVLWLLGVPPRRIRHEIEDVQNPAAGALYFVISLIAATWSAKLSSDGLPTPANSDFESALWIFGGILFATLFTIIAYWIAHRVLIPSKDEGFLSWIRREVIKEQNAALALFLGGLAIAPFMAILYQIF
ncbi:MAG: hypothetical protein OHK0023_21670 [Anaerolineae bacterium]